jgi:ATP-binding cassette, subfamily B, multidrug efflux pump
MMVERGTGARRPAAQVGPGPRWGPMASFGMPVEKPKNAQKTFSRLLGYFRPMRTQLLAALVAAIISTLFNVVGPKILGLATTELFEGVVARSQGTGSVDFAAIGRILLILAGLYVFSSAFMYLMQFLMTEVAQKSVYAMRKEVEAKFDRLPLSFYDSRTHGEILSRAVNDMDSIASTLQQNLTQLITSVVTAVGVIVMMLTISPLLTLVVGLTLPISLFGTATIAKRSQTYFRRQQMSLGQLNGHVEEMFTGHKIVKAFGGEPQAIAEFKQLNDSFYQAGWRAQFAIGMIMPLMNFVGNVGYVAVAVIGGILVMGRAIAIGDVQAFIQYSRQFAQPIMQLSGIANTIQLTLASAERVFELLDEPEESRDAAAARVLPEPRGAVQFDHVRFSYKPDVPLIEDLSLEVQPGQTIAIVGPTGAGKTTLVNLLLRFYDVQGGAIRVDGVAIRDLERGELRRLFGMVLQDTWLFSGTIRENIAYGRLGASQEEIVQAAKAAQADHFIRTLPDSYDTVLTEDATTLSQGQKQLLTIARAFLADPAILILDEATSSVDTRTEVLIQQAMAELMEGRTSFVIAHRLSTIRNADLILVMSHGRIVEQGSHEELLGRRGVYAELYESQFSGRLLEEIPA